MSPSWKILRQEIRDKSYRYLLAVSGGADSMLMLDFFSRIDDIYIEVVHFNHNIREASYIDRDLVINFCKDRGIICHTKDCNTLNSKSNEKDARDARWQYIEEIARNFNFEYIVTGHHADDQVEHVLLRLMRGSSHNNLTMTKFTYFDNHIRYKPFLNISKQDILKQCQHRDIEYIEDVTNSSLKYDRNFIRHEIIPMLNTRTNIKSAILTGVNKNEF